MARLANSLARFRDQVNAAYPNRSKASDGWIGDAAHRASASDHNPNGADVVCALDLTHDPANGFDAHAMADRLRVHRHPDLKYIISNRRICGAWTNWQWQPYYGSNPHSSHVHFSVGRGDDGQSQQPYDNTTDWAISGVAPTPTSGKSLDTVAREVIAGVWGNGTDRQAKLAAAGYNYNEVQNRVNAFVGVTLAPAKKSNEEVAAEVLKGYWGNGDERVSRLRSAGYDSNVIQSIVNSTVSTHPAPARKSNEQLAGEVLAGLWGNGTDRQAKLQAAGYNYDAVQAVVNQSTMPARKSNDTIAREVINGVWGNGVERVNRLRNAGYDPNAIQTRVNQLV